MRAVSSTLCGFSLAGPRARDILQPLVQRDLGPSAFRLFDVAQTAVGFAPCVVTRAGFTGELGYEVWTTPDFFESLYDDLLEAFGAPGGALFFRWLRFAAVAIS